LGLLPGSVAGTGADGSLDPAAPPLPALIGGSAFVGGAMSPSPA
jgi:hypothetical protein